jgi:two-component system phosphate regulon sensor histidine kinase PhoR
LRVSLFWRPVVICLALVAAILVAVQWTSPDTLGKVWPLLLIFLAAAGIAIFLSFRSVDLRIRRLKQSTERAAAGDFTPFERDHSHDELADLADALSRAVTGLGQTIRTLTDERNRSSAILGSMVEGVAVVTADEHILYCNWAFEQILELPEGSSQGRTLVEALRQADLVALVRQALSGAEELTGEVEVGTVRRRNFSVTAAPVRAAGANGAVLVLHDITELRRLERVRRDFVANVSHEFKTPLTDDLLKLSRIEAGRLELEPRPIRVEAVVNGCVETARLNAEARGLQIHVDLQPNMPAVRGDGAQLGEVLQNLLDNALQYTPPGGKIELKARANGHDVIFTVIDTGIGIPESDLERVFERFYRVDTARSREAGGTGLGLAIARHIVDAHGGRIWVESAVGQGSRFHFSVPSIVDPQLR